jgi:hypothetical protein
MICPKCGKKIPLRDRYCAYCGASTGLLPVRILERLPRRLILIPAIVIIAAAILLLVSWSQQEQWYINSASDDTINQPGVVIYSEYVGPEAPSIDGVLTAGEWGDPSMSMELIFSEVNSQTQQPGEASFYCMNDNDYLYVALTLSSSNPDFYIFDEEAMEMECRIIFDGDNDGYPDANDDIKILNAGWWEDPQLSDFMDSYVDPVNYWATYEDKKDKNGEGAYGYSKDASNWVAEFKIPLDSGDPQDIKVKPGDTIGVRWEIRGIELVKWYEFWDLITKGRYSGDSFSVYWPETTTGGGWTAKPVSPPCRSLVLASGPESAVSVD